MPYPNTRPTAPNGPAHCPRCHADVIWCVTVNQRAQMVDGRRDPNGNSAVRQDHTGRYLVRQLTRERPTPEAGEQLHMPHAATCTAPTPRQTRPPLPRGRRGVRPHRWQR